MAATPLEPEIFKELVSHFPLSGEVIEGVPYGSGHINDTYLVSLKGPAGPARFIFQRINNRIFKDVPALMENIGRVTEHLRAKLAVTPGSDPERETLTVVPTREGARFHRTEAGQFWRVYVFIRDALTYDVPRSNRQIGEAAAAFGRFQSLLADLPAPPLHETIVDFHHTPLRLAALEKAIRDDVRGRVKECGPEIEFALSCREMTGRVVGALADGSLPGRVTHNDTKINNVMLDNATGRGVCVIDLDTVMPGSLLYDFGDQARSMIGDFAENERDLGRVCARMDRFEALVRGYLSTAGSTMTPLERDWLPLSGMLMTYEVGIRFLADHLQGDVYFRINRPGENLDRARTQLALVRSMQSQEAAMREIVRSAV